MAICLLKRATEHHQVNSPLATTFPSFSRPIGRHKTCHSFILHFPTANDCLCGSVRAVPLSRTFWIADIPLQLLLQIGLDPRRVGQMIKQQFYDRLDAIETELLKLERAIPFGQNPDLQIIAAIHVTLAADLPGLISRIEHELTLESYHLTLKCLDQFERNLAVCNFDGTMLGYKYRELELRTRELFADVLTVYTQSGIGKN